MNGGVRLSVFNEGDGLPEEELGKIWEKFYRTDRARTREAGGTGVENVEGGICFWFEVPDVLGEAESEKV